MHIALADYDSLLGGSLCAQEAVRTESLALCVSTRTMGTTCRSLRTFTSLANLSCSMMDAASSFVFDSNEWSLPCGCGVYFSYSPPTHSTRSNVFAGTELAQVKGTAHRRATGDRTRGGAELCAHLPPGQSRKGTEKLRSVPLPYIYMLSDFSLVCESSGASDLGAQIPPRQP